MSYTIEYNRQFIKTKNGYIPCWLHGDNNVTEGWGKNERRARDWSVFMNWLDVTEDFMIDEVKKMFNDYDQHWKRGSIWVTNEGMIRWVKNGCKSASTIEEIIAVNPFLRNVDCKIIFWDINNNRQEILKSTIATSRGLEGWLNEVNKFKTSKEYQGCKGFYPVIDFLIEDLKHPNVRRVEEFQDNDEVVVKYKNDYLVSMTENSSNWCKNIRSATVFKYLDVKEMKEKYLGTHMGSYLVQSKLIKAEKKTQTMYVIKFIDGTFAGQYLGSRKNGKVNLVFKPEYAKQYTTRKSAENALANYKISVSKYGNLDIEQY